MGRRISSFACLLGALLLAVAASGCGEVDPTEVVVVVTGDYAVPAELDYVIVTVTKPDGTTARAEADLTTGGFPRSLGLYNQDGPLGPYLVEAVGSSGGTTVVRRRARFSFERDRSLEIELPLLSECAGVQCACTNAFCTTCGVGGTCVNAVVDPQPFDGVGRALGEGFDFDL